MFEVRATDLAGRIGRLKTKKGILETPCILPVLHPVRQAVAPKEIARMGFKGVMINAYTTMKAYGSKAKERGIHGIIDYDGVIMTDSGGYQVLEYGDLGVTPLEVMSFQEEIGSDIAVVLDTPTGIKVNGKRARETVERTLKAARETMASRSRADILWAGPIQGGNHLDLLKYSAEETAKMGFDLFALGSPTEVMEGYNFKLLARMIITTKRALPVSKPLHLFGAGHPITIPLAVALGCDLFDSASYMIYARDGRYMTEYGTMKLDELSYLPCCCPICSTHTRDEMKSLPADEGVQKLATHNLYVLMKEVEATKQAIEDGRLWEYLGVKARAHPRLQESIKLLVDYQQLEDGTPLFKAKGLFFYDTVDQVRPEAFRYHRRLVDDVLVPSRKKVLLLIPETDEKPFYSSPIYRELSKALGKAVQGVQVCFLTIPYGIVPVELSDVYPLSQYTSSITPDRGIKEVVKRVKEFVSLHPFKRIVVFNPSKAHALMSKKVAKALNCDFIDAFTERKSMVKMMGRDLATTVKKLEG